MMLRTWCFAVAIGIASGGPVYGQSRPGFPSTKPTFGSPTSTGNIRHAPAIGSDIGVGVGAGGGRGFGRDASDPRSGGDKRLRATERGPLGTTGGVDADGIAGPANPLGVGPPLAPDTPATTGTGMNAGIPATGTPQPAATRGAQGTRR